MQTKPQNKEPQVDERLMRLLVLWNEMPEVKKELFLARAEGYCDGIRAAAEREKDAKK